jgi:hypothetical protein
MRSAAFFDSQQGQCPPSDHHRLGGWVKALRRDLDNQRRLSISVHIETLKRVDL